ICVNAPGYLTRAWQSLTVQINETARAIQLHNIPDVLVSATGTTMLVLPIVSIALTYLLLCRRAGISLALRRNRVDLTLASTTNPTNQQPQPHKLATAA
ncbi:MAG: hypothetical protein ABSG43_28535, partial [Solirubrobacteraceae bacterium]